MSLRKRGKTEKNRIDECLVEIVDQMKKNGCNKIEWKKVSSTLMSRFQIKLQYKQCYNRYKNYLDKNVDTKLKLQPHEEQQIVQLHYLGATDKQIKKQLNLHTISENALKNTWKVSKQSMGRILRIIYSESFLRTNIPSSFLKGKNQHFRIFLILFSGTSLLQYYLAKKISIFGFKQLTEQYDKNKKNYQKLKAKSSIKIRNKFEDAMNLTKKNIQEQLETIFALYEEIYLNQSRKNQSNGKKDKQVDTKFMYLKSVLLKIPFKVLENERQLNSINIDNQINGKSQFFEKGPSMSMETQNSFQGGIFQEWDSEMCNKYSAQDMFYLPSDQQYNFQNDKNSKYGEKDIKDVMDMPIQLDSNWFIEK